MNLNSSFVYFLFGGTAPAFKIRTALGSRCTSFGLNLGA
jgi:hypothetical protein